jgi:hypothetical protein
MIRSLQPLAVFAKEAGAIGLVLQAFDHSLMKRPRCRLISGLMKSLEADVFDIANLFGLWRQET